MRTFFGLRNKPPASPREAKVLDHPGVKDAIEFVAEAHRTHAAVVCTAPHCHHEWVAHRDKPGACDWCGAPGEALS